MAKPLGEPLLGERVQPPSLCISHSPNLMCLWPKCDEASRVCDFGTDEQCEQAMQRVNASQGRVTGRTACLCTPVGPLLEDRCAFVSCWSSWAHDTSLTEKVKPWGRVAWTGEDSGPRGQCPQSSDSCQVKEKFDLSHKMKAAGWGLGFARGAG